MMKTLTIIGAGNLGKTLGRLWHQHGTFRIQDVCCRSLAHADAATAFIGSGRAVEGLQVLRAADVYLISTPDDQVVACSDLLAGTGLLHGDSIVFHCSGALAASVLAEVRRSGAAVASIHPVRSFASPETV